MSNKRWNKEMVFAVAILCLIWLGTFYQHGWLSKYKANLGSKATATAKPINSWAPPLDPTRVALLLETRTIPHLPALLSHFISVLPAPWVFRFVGSTESNALISSSTLSSHIATGKLVVTELPQEYDISNQESLSMTLTNISFYKDFLAPAEWLLNFQSDSMICAATEHNIEYWVSKNYSWLGAPWGMEAGWKGGNGGLSLRHIPPLLKVLEKEIREPFSAWEDVWICSRLQEIDDANMPEPQIGVQFSVETMWGEKPFGYHLMGSGKWMSPNIWGNDIFKQQIFEYCPEIKIILSMELLPQKK